MTTAPDAGQSSIESHGPSLESHVGDMLGDYRVDGPQDPETESAAGTTPAEPTAGTEGEEGAGQPTDGADASAAAASDGTTPDTPTDAASEDDPFKDTTALSFQANGRTVALDGIREFKDGGAVVRPEALHDLKQKLAERETLQGRLHSQSQENQRLLAFAECRVTGVDGREQVLTGPDALMHLHVDAARKDALISVMDEVLSSADSLLSLLAQDKDGKATIDPTALAQLQREIRLSAGERAAEVRSRFSTRVAEASRPAPAPIDFQTVAPSLIANVAAEKGLDPSALSADERAILAEQLEHHVKGTQVSLAWQSMAERMIRLAVARKADAAKLVTSTQDATKKGAANLAAAARGVKPGAKTPVVPIKPQQPTPADAAGDAFDLMLTAGAKAMRQRA